MNEATVELLTRLETAVEGSSDLTQDLLQALGWQWECMGCPGGGLWKDPHHMIHCETLPIATETVEAARALVPENISIAAHQQSNGHWKVEFSEHRQDDPLGQKIPNVTARAKTLALAVCSAMLKWQLLER